MTKAQRIWLFVFIYALLLLFLACVYFYFSVKLTAQTIKTDTTIIEAPSTNISKLFNEKCGECHRPANFKIIKESVCLNKHCIDTLDRKMLKAWLNDYKKNDYKNSNKYRGE